MPTPDIDSIDKRMLSELQKNGRLSNIELAERIVLSESASLPGVMRVQSSLALKTLVKKTELPLE